jgi:hypothetical protein
MKVYEVNLKFIESSINFNMTILENKIKNFQIFFKEFLKLWVRCTFQAPSFLDLKGDVRPKLIIIIIIDIIIIIIIIIIIDFTFKIKIYVFFIIVIFIVNLIFFSWFSFCSQTQSQNI